MRMDRVSRGTRKTHAPSSPMATPSRQAAMSSALLPSRFVDIYTAMLHEHSRTDTGRFAESNEDALLQPEQLAALTQLLPQWVEIMTRVSHSPATRRRRALGLVKNDRDARGSAKHASYYARGSYSYARSNMGDMNSRQSGHSCRNGTCVNAHPNRRRPTDWSYLNRRVGDEYFDFAHLSNIPTVWRNRRCSASDSGASSSSRAVHERDHAAMLSALMPLPLLRRLLRDGCRAGTVNGSNPDQAASGSGAIESCADTPCQGAMEELVGRSRVHAIVVYLFALYMWSRPCGPDHVHHDATNAAAVAAGGESARMSAKAEVGCDSRAKATRAATLSLNPHSLRVATTSSSSSSGSSDRSNNRNSCDDACLVDDSLSSATAPPSALLTRLDEFMHEVQQTLCAAKPDRLGSAHGDSTSLSLAQLTHALVSLYTCRNVNSSSSSSSTRTRSTCAHTRSGHRACRLRVSTLAQALFVECATLAHAMRSVATPSASDRHAACHASYASTTSGCGADDFFVDAVSSHVVVQMVRYVRHGVHQAMAHATKKNRLDDLPNSASSTTATAATRTSIRTGNSETNNSSTTKGYDNNNKNKNHDNNDNGNNDDDNNSYSPVPAHTKCNNSVTKDSEVEVTAETAVWRVATLTARATQLTMHRANNKSNAAMRSPSGKSSSVPGQWRQGKGGLAQLQNDRPDWLPQSVTLERVEFVAAVLTTFHVRTTTTHDACGIDCTACCADTNRCAEVPMRWGGQQVKVAAPERYVAAGELRWHTSRSNNHSEGSGSQLPLRW